MSKETKAKNKTKGKSKGTSKAKQNRFNKLFIIAFIVLIVVTIIAINNKSEEKEEVSAEVKFETELFGSLDKQTAKISKYLVYGTHLNLDGTLDISSNESNVETSSQVYKANLMMKSMNNDDINIDTEYTVKDNKITFTTGDKINEGIDLEKITTSSYYLILRVIYSDDQVKYYSLANDTNYENIEYYTITKNGENNKININFNKYDEIEYLNLKVSKVNTLPKDVYDVVIDPGHGGIDVGAVSGNYYESDIVLDCAKKLKIKLEELGLKVFLTRDGTESKEEDTAHNMYDKDGRITLAMESHAKLFISLHMNSSEENLTTGGVEIYCPSNINLKFAGALADNIVTTANTNYSYLDTYKVSKGIYIHNFSEHDIQESRQAAINNGYSPYSNITTSTSYLFMLRETGGIATGAYVDGRNKAYSANKYYNSNVGIESYLVEMGYMNVSKDLNNVLNNANSYMEAIANSIESFYLKNDV